MPNTFGGFPLVDPRCVREHRVRFRRDMIPQLELANSYYSVSGRWPDVGWLLLDRESYDQISRYSSTLSLVIQDFTNPALTFSNLSIVQARCVTMGLPSDPNAIYLIQVTNGQGVIYNQWFQKSVNAQYNIEAPAYDGQYYSSTMNGGSAWTWNTMLGNLWGMASSQLGSFPGLASVPSGTPENFVFVGVPLWEAITRLLSHLGMSLAGTYPNISIVTSGAADSAFTALQSSYQKYLEDDMEYIDGGSGRVPSSVKVYFPRRNQIYGTEETVRRDSLQWQSTPAHVITVNAPATFSSSTGEAYLWDSFSVRYDQDGVALPADVVTATAIAAERVTQYFNTIFRGTSGFMRQVYSGLLPFTTGSLVDGVRWYNTGRDEDDRTSSKHEERSGWRTEIVRGYVWPEVTFSTDLHGITGLI